MDRKKKSPLAKSRHLEKFCQILDDLPVNFKFRLENTGKDLDGPWVKIPSHGVAAWQNGSKILLNSSFYPFRMEVFEAIEKEGFPLRETYYPKMRGNIISSLTKERVKELYHRQKKSLQDIAKEYGCTKQMVFLLMEKYGLKRRTHSEALKEAVKQNKVALIRPKR